MGFLREIKLSPLVLFVILLLLLAVSVFVGKTLQSWVNPEAKAFESFIGYNSTIPILSSQVVSGYSSNPIIKVYDNIYFDNINGNIVKLLSASNGNISGNTSLTSINVCPRDGTSCSNPQLLPITTPIANSTLSTMSSSYIFFEPASNLYTDAVTISEAANNTITTSSTVSYISNNLVFYVAWKTDTFLHVIDSNTTGNVPHSALSAYIPSSGTPVARYYDAAAATPTTLGNNFPVQLNDIGYNSVSEPNDDKLIKLQNYDQTKQVYQIVYGIFFDISNASLIVGQPGGGISVYTRPTSTSAGSYVDPVPQTFAPGQSASNTSTSVSTVSYFPWYLITPDKNFLIMYIAFGQNTIVYVMAIRNGQWTLVNLKRFVGNNMVVNGTIDNNGTLMFPNVGNNSFGQASNTNNFGVGNPGFAGTGPAAGTDGNALSDYYRWLAFWNTVANVTDPQSLQSASNVVPKTTVVPSVCPNCPNCSSCKGGVCTGCGGQGGAGTNFGYGYGQYGRGPGIGQILEDTGSGTKQLLEEAGSGTVGLVKDAGSAGASAVKGGVGLAKDTVQGGVGLAKDTVQGGVGLAKDTVGGAVGLAKDTVQGGVGLAREAGSDIAGLLKTNPTQVGQPQTDESGSDQGQGKRGLGRQGIPGIDPYSYYGALPAKGANYMPITADFSAFGK